MEVLDVYNDKKELTGKKYIRGSNNLKENEYVMVIEIIVLNMKNEILLSKRAENKKINPLKWETTQGSVRAGENSIEAVKRELNEELGLTIHNDIDFFKTIKDKREHIFKDLFFTRGNLKISEVKFLDGEVIDAKWVTIDQFIKMKKRGELAQNMNFNVKYIRDIYKKLK